MLLLHTLTLAALGHAGSVRAGNNEQAVLGSSQAPLDTTFHANHILLDGSKEWSGLADYVRSTLDRWHIVGASVAIRDGRKNQTWAQGYGYADLHNKQLVTPSTMFFTGSTTKSFTAAALSLLIDNSSSYSNIQWTTPISQLLPSDFVLSDSWATQHITIEDALSHRTGVARHDLAWWPTLPELVRTLRHLPMFAEPRTQYQYSNKMYAVAGYIIETLTSTWLGDFFSTHLFQPMNMTSTFLGYAQAKASNKPLAKSYHYRPSTNSHVFMPYELSPADYPAGDIVSTVSDYTNYLTTLIHSRKPFSPSAHRELKTPRILVKLSSPPYDGPQFYCLGWEMTTFRGETVYSHTGATAEFISIMIMIPSLDFSIVVFGNTIELGFLNIAYRALYDAFDVPASERIDFDARLEESKLEAARDLKNCHSRAYPDLPDPRLPPSLPLAKYTGTFENLGYGKVFIKFQCEEVRGAECETGNRSASSGFDEERRLRLTRREDAYPHIIGEMVHQSGEYWLAWGFTEENQDPEGPTACMRAEYRIGANGDVTEFGFDFRLEGEDVPLVWFKKIA